MWKLVLGSLFAGTVIIFPVMTHLGYGLEGPVQWAAAPMHIRALIVWCMLSFMGLWLWMLGDFFVGRPMRARVLVGFSLVFFNILAAVLYFGLVYAPRVRKEI